MIIAKQLENSNIAEYIIYMFYIEDLIRTYNLSIKEIEKEKISEFIVNNKEKKDITDWYKNLIKMMINEGIEKKGHFSFLKEKIDKLNEMHLKLLAKEDTIYIDAYKKAMGDIMLFRDKSNKKLNDIEVCLQSLYMVMLLKMKKRPISNETQQAIDNISKLMALLSSYYHQQ
ncbi:MAG: DUF4924 family protein [Marinilabiliales bacterium]